MKCPKCGKEVATGSKFCKFCGVRLETAQNDINQQGMRRGKNHGRISIASSIIIAAIILIVALAVYFLVTNNHSIRQPNYDVSTNANDVQSTANSLYQPIETSNTTDTDTITPTNLPTEATELEVQSIALQYNGTTASGGHLNMYINGSTLTLTVSIDAIGSVSADDITWESSNEAIVSVSPQEDGTSCVLTKHSDGDCIITVTVCGFVDSLSINASSYGSSTEYTLENVLSQLPDFFYFSSNAGGWWTRIYIEGDGSFYGLYMDSDLGYSGFEGMELDGLPQYINSWYYRYCSFSGKLEVVQQVNNLEFQLQVTNIVYDHTPGTWEEVVRDGEPEVYVYTEPYGLTPLDTLYLYLPGRETADLDGECLQWISYSANDFEYPEQLKYWGLYNPDAHLAFVGKNGEFPGELATA